MIHPIVYKMTCSTLVHVLTLPLDITCTTLLTNKIFKFQLKEINAILTASLFFSIQNLLYDKLVFINSNLIKSSLSGILSTPFYLYHELNKVKNRYAINPNLLNLRKIVIIGLIRQITIIFSLYNFIFVNNKLLGIFGTFITNFYGILMKNYILKVSFPVININLFNLKRIIFLDILRCSLNDYLTLQLIYNYNLFYNIYNELE
jgi:hypothetical protein